MLFQSGGTCSFGRKSDEEHRYLVATICAIDVFVAFGLGMVDSFIVIDSFIVMLQLHGKQTNKCQFYRLFINL